MTTHQQYKAPKRGQIDLDSFLYECERRAVERETIIQRNGNEPQRFCSCAEILVNNVRQSCGRWHSCEYVEARNKLIPEAEKLATAQVGEPPDDNDKRNTYGYRWTKIFVYELDRLAAALLKQSGNGQREQKPV
jgi:hypothetical protein